MPAQIVVAGATGHVGSALVRRLVAAGRSVRCLVRDPARLGHVRAEVDAVQVDLRDGERLRAELPAGSVAYFLVHALTAGDGVGEAERALAESFAAAARQAQVGRIVYLEAAADADVEGSPILEIGGADRLSYRELVAAVAAATGATGVAVSVPVPETLAAAATRAAAPLTARLPGEAQEALKLLESMRHATVVRDRSAELLAVRPMGVADAIAAALG